jgi:DNA-binding CsgD family transcriptional regulator
VATTESDDQNKRDRFLKSLLQDKIYLNSDADTRPVHITKRELDIYYWLIQGKSSKEIAKILNLSYRTVESYLAILKRKLQIFKTSQLIHSASKYNIEEIWCLSRNN